MPVFKVTIIRTYETEIEVIADSIKDARTQVVNYGLVEATSDYKVINEELKVERIKKVIENL